MYVPCDLGLELFVVCYSVGDEIGLYHVWKEWGVGWALFLVRVGVDCFCPLVTIDVE